MSAEGAGHRRFATTRWSLILAAADPRSSAAEEALAALCELYWFPVYAFVRRTGVSADDASDLTQAFFATVLEKHYFQDARQERGRFRSFLLTAVRHFLSNQRDAERALKRGGGKAPLPLEFDDGERRYQLEPADTLTPEHVFERRWALAVLDQAIVRLSTRYDSSERQKAFVVLKKFLGGNEPESYASAAAALGTTEASLRVTVHRFRKQFAACLRDVVHETVDRTEDVDGELRYLLSIVSR